MIESTIIIAAIFSLSYALFVFNRTIPPQWIWLSVVVGDGLYDLTFGPLLYFLIQDWTGESYPSLIFLPLGWHALWGSPMILLELKKHFGLSGEALEARRPRWRGKRFLD